MHLARESHPTTVATMNKTRWRIIILINMFPAYNQVKLSYTTTRAIEQCQALKIRDRSYFCNSITWRSQPLNPCKILQATSPGNPVYLLFALCHSLFCYSVNFRYAFHLKTCLTYFIIYYNTTSIF